MAINPLYAQMFTKKFGAILGDLKKEKMLFKD